MNPTVVLVHGAFTGSGSWKRVIRRMHANRLPVVAVANPLRDLEGDAAYVRDVVDGIGGPVVLVGHSYGGMVITEAVHPAVRALVYVSAFAPETGESALTLAQKFEGGTLAENLVSYPVATGGVEFRIAADRFHRQFCHDVDPEWAAVTAVLQRPITERALTDLATRAAWRETPSWFVYGERDATIPVEAMRFMAERAGSMGTREISGASHAIAVSWPDTVTRTILDAVTHVR
ncbi:alpha/beta fold hydrolase [Herbidospora sp. NEAU-GS84]|uniref:Alpha/beta fold hydrolase n=1 Tax=Herbidospora solisilvae TaxID=2696284 RepID=A0A7C9NH00_9ACTN|nr:alpha/beta hydrolase [Herbidospora solisilvae]NAS22232.1 alpha/beta fold hydrolase [Herbidospora solisilvae]